MPSFINYLNQEHLKIINQELEKKTQLENDNLRLKKLKESINKLVNTPNYSYTSGI